jgi:hypothetical protein
MSGQAGDSGMRQPVFGYEPGPSAVMETINEKTPIPMPKMPCVTSGISNLRSAIYPKLPTLDDR